jgi:general secretion pathway protein M
MKPLTPRERKLVAVALLLGVIALVWLGVIQPLLGGFAERAERRTELADQYSQNERLIGRIGQLRRVAEEQRRQRTAFALPAPDAGQAAELLKERLAAALDKSGGELRGTEAVETRAGWARASASAVVSNGQLLDWLAGLTAQQPYLVLESVTIGADRALNSNRVDLMDVKIEASIPFAPANAR